MLSLPPPFIPLHLKLLLQSQGGSRQLQDRVLQVKTYTTASGYQENLHRAQRAVKTCNTKHHLLLTWSPAAHWQVQAGAAGHCCCMLALPLCFLEVQWGTAAIVCIKRTSHQVHCDHSCILITVKNKMTTVCGEKRTTGAVVIGGVWWPLRKGVLEESEERMILTNTQFRSI